MRRNTKLATTLGASALLLASAGTSAVEMEMGKAKLSFYGELDVWAGSVENPGSADSTLKLDSGGMNTSFAGMSGTMPLMDGLTGVAALEMFLRPDVGDNGRFNGDTFFARSAYVGLQGKYGKVTAGRNTAPYYLPNVFFNSFGGSFAFSPTILHTYSGGLFGPVAGDSGWSNSIAYYSPSVNGLRGSVVYAFGEQPGESGDNKMGFHLLYNTGGFGMTLSGYQVDAGAATAPNANGGGLGPLGSFSGLGVLEDQMAMMFGASYDFGAAKIFGQYQYMETELTGGDADIDTFTAGVRVPTPSGAVKVAYGMSDFGDDMDDERNTTTVGYDHYFGGNFDLYAAVMHDEIKSLESSMTYGVGARFRW
ncbi:porin [uncultured Marinobacter sp.]|uniref:porin n=1 Tax=uncultured Marinobacter sp. TaxID=187379 RepID=UPI0030D76D7D